MKNSMNERVQKFLNEVGEFDAVKFTIIQKLRNTILDHYPDVRERMMYGGIMFSLDEDFGGLFVSKNHVSLEFSKGYQMDDPKSLLEGSGKFRRHLKFKSIADISKKDVVFFLNQAVR